MDTVMPTVRVREEPHPVPQRETTSSKRCSRCRTVKPVEDFNTHARNKDGLQYWCRPCQIEDRAQRRVANPDKEIKYREQNRERIRAAVAQHRADNAEAVRAKEAEYRAANRERLRKYFAKWRGANAQRVRVQRAALRSALSVRTDDEIAAARARLHPDGRKRCPKCREHLPFDRFHAGRGRDDGLQPTCKSCKDIKLRTIAADAWTARGLGTTCVYCGSLPEQIDHIHPVVLGGTDEPHNLAPACMFCNTSKGANLVSDWLARHPDRATYVAEHHPWLAEPARSLP